MENQGRIIGINGNVVTIEFEGTVRQNEVVYAVLDNTYLKSEVIRIKGNRAEIQVFDNTKGLKSGDKVKLSGKLLSVKLGPGLVGQLYDGLQNPLRQLAEKSGYFLERGKYITALAEDKKWDFTPCVSHGDRVRKGDAVGSVPEGMLMHKIMIPFYLSDQYEVIEIAQPGSYGIQEQIALIKNKKGNRIPVKMCFNWPVKKAITAYKERLSPTEPLNTGIRIIDTLFPIAKGGTYCIPGPFGAGKTVLQQITSRYAEVDIVILAACGERASEVVETILNFPKLIDPHTGKSLMERTIIICNTSSMPVAARESSVYTAVTLAEYYRQMGLDVLLLADSTSRWAQAMREKSGRLEEIPGEEAFPAYLESVIAGFYERAGRVRLKDGNIGSVTIGGTVSPAGGSFEEPVTQATLKVVGAFQALSKERADARRFPAIGPLESWSRYKGFIDTPTRKYILKTLAHANEIEQMIKVVGEEGTSLEDYVFYLQSEFFDNVYLQQNAFDPVDAATPENRQKRVLDLITGILKKWLQFRDKEDARKFFNRLRQTFLDYNTSTWKSDSFYECEKKIQAMVAERSAPFPETLLSHISLAAIEPDMNSTLKRSEKAFEHESFQKEPWDNIPENEENL
ncbi:MAG: V-type ATP synthase subunit A [Deltaproteobacteria bacterium]|nr:V-type ATP synthase subunit A [Deltaproteobacteria bacterium]